MAIDVSPRFTVSLRGYDKDEVEQYLESVSERTTQSDEQLYDLQEQTRYLEEEHDRLISRVEELEGAIRSETPHSVSALGERITLILNEAEEGAADTLAQAQAQSEYLLAQARQEVDELRREATRNRAQAADTLTAAQRQAETLAERVESDARARAAGIVGDAELRAQRRTEQMEKWAAEVVASTEAEQARLADEFAMIRRRHDAEIRSLLGERDDTMAALRSLQTSLARALEQVPSGRTTRTAVATQPAPAPEAERRSEVLIDSRAEAAAADHAGANRGADTAEAKVGTRGDNDREPGVDTPDGGNDRGPGVDAPSGDSSGVDEEVAGAAPVIGAAETAGSDDPTGANECPTSLAGGADIHHDGIVAAPAEPGATGGAPSLDAAPGEAARAIPAEGADGVTAWSCSLYDLEADTPSTVDVTDVATAGEDPV